MFPTLRPPNWMPFRIFLVHQIARRESFCSRRCFSVSSRLRSMQLNYPKQWMNDYDGWESWTEDLSKYERGIYYAVHLGDILGNGRYRVLHKLGNGSFSQVWLAKDQSPGSDFSSTRDSKTSRLTSPGAMAT